MTKMFQTFAILALLLCSERVAFQIRDVRDIAVIGGGVGGLVSSTLLSRAGLSVLLVEKNERCGGRMNSEFISHPTLANATYRFDVGPSLLLLPDVYQETFEMLGTKIEDHVELLKVEPFYRCYFEEDETFAEITSDQEKMKSTINNIEPNAYEKFVDYLKIAGDFLRFGLPTVIQEKPDFTHFGSFIMACIKIFPLKSHDDMLQQYFKSKKLQAMMSFQDLYIGLSPYKSPAIFSLLQALELERGIYYPKGGFCVVAESLEKIAKQNGVEIINNCNLQSINLSDIDVWKDSPKGTIDQRKLRNINIVIKNQIKSTSTEDLNIMKNKNTDTNSNIVKNLDVIENSNENIDSMKTGNKEILDTKINEKESTFSHHSIRANRFITNIDAPEFENKMISISERDERSSTGVPSCGIVQLHLAFNTTLKSLSHHTLFLSKSYKNSWNSVDNPDTAIFNPEEFNFYVHTPSRTDSTVCPINHDAITVLVPVPPLPAIGKGKGEGKLLDINIVRNAVLDKLQKMENASKKQLNNDNNIININNHIVGEKIRVPENWQEEFSLYRGSAFGLAHSIDQLNLLRPRLRHPRIENLYRVGASTRPGNGVPLVMIGARLTSEAILRDINKQKKLEDKILARKNRNK